jgi:hypothetical protein
MTSGGKREGRQPYVPAELVTDRANYPADDEFANAVSAERTWCGMAASRPWKPSSAAKACMYEGELRHSASESA